MLVRASLLSGCNKQVTRPLGSAAKASSFGANTVNGPFGSARAVTRSAAWSAAPKVSNTPALMAVVGMSTGSSVVVLVSVGVDAPQLAKKASISTLEGTKTDVVVSKREYQIRHGLQCMQSVFTYQSQSRE